LTRLNTTLADREDDAIDTPELGAYVGEMFAALIRTGGFKLADLAQLSEEIRTASWADKMFTALFNGLFTSKDQSARRETARPWVAELASAGLGLKDLLPPRYKDSRKDYLRLLDRAVRHCARE